MAELYTNIPLDMNRCEEMPGVAFTELPHIFSPSVVADFICGVDLPIKLLNENATLPTYGSEDAAGMDLYAALPKDETIVIPCGETRKIPTGIATAIPKGYVGLVYARSGLATKEGLAPANKVAVIDADYRGEWFIPLHNHSNEPRHVFGGERIAQCIITPYYKANLQVVDELDDTERGEGGFGSTGKN